MKRAIYPGSFDPVTNGHVDIILRSSKIVDRLIVGVLNNSAKKSLFSVEERVSMLKELTKDLPNVEVTSFDGLLVDYMREIDASIIVRGLRAVTDFEYELQIAQTNHIENTDIETIFLTTNLQYSYLSSTIVKEFASYGGDISKFVPEQFVDRIYEKYNIKKIRGETMSSKIEQIIDEIEEYIDNCKPHNFSSSKIVVNRDEIDELLTELRMKTPEEIKRYQKIISNQEAILADAKAKAEAIIAQAQIKTDELVSEHQIMQQAYAQANEVVMIATKQAQDILDNATNDANNIRMSAIAYTDDMLKNLEASLTGAIETSKARSESLIGALQGFLDIVTANRAELVPEQIEHSKEQEAKEQPAEQSTEELPEIDVSADLLQ